MIWQVAIGRDLGIEEPQLMKIMRATLHTHTEWFKLQMCKDRFESLLKIDSLKDVTRPMIASAMQSKLYADSCTHGSSTVTSPSSVKMADDGSSPTQVSSTDVCDESAILKVMVRSFSLFLPFVYLFLLLLLLLLSFGSIRPIQTANYYSAWLLCFHVVVFIVPLSLFFFFLNFEVVSV